MQNLESASSIHRPLIVGVGGFTSEVGKTTLVCDLLQAFPGWEAIKTTRGHYRSCGKDPHACCVSHLLEDEPVVKSGREQTYTSGKDTGRYWDAGAANVHWVIATDAQVEKGVREALSRVQAPGVFVEGNSFTRTIEPDHFIMVVHPDRTAIKTTARQALNGVSAFYFSGESSQETRSNLKEFLGRLGNFDSRRPMFSAHDFSGLVTQINQASRQTANQFA
ncbi:MAG: hypothetical protein AABN95_11570 [Acidobacteriota bacterium]